MLLKREKGKMPVPAKQPRSPLFTTCVKRGRNGSFYFKNRFLDTFRGLEKRDLPSSNCAKMFVTGEGLGLRV